MSVDSRYITKMCAECGMPVLDNEYHPYAACLMFKACGDSETVQANLDVVQAHGYQLAIDSLENKNA